MSASTVQRYITGDAEKPDYSKEPQFINIAYNHGKIQDINQMVANIDEWLQNQIANHVEEDVQKKTLNLRNTYAKLTKNPTQYKDIQAWENRQDDKERRKSFCEERSCTVSLRL